MLREHRTEEGKINGALFYVEREDEVVVQAVYGSSVVREVLLQELSDSAKKVSYYLRPEEGRGVEEERRGMIRLLDPLRFLQHLATLHPDLRGAWAYSDELFPCTRWALHSREWGSASHALSYIGCLSEVSHDGGASRAA